MKMNVRSIGKRILGRQIFREDFRVRITSKSYRVVFEPRWTQQQFRQFNTPNPSSTNEDKEYIIDFFGEPVTFLGEGSYPIPPTETTLVFDAHLVQIVSRGRVSNDGGDEFGIQTKAAHSSAKTWSDLIKHCFIWTRRSDDGTLVSKSPMLIAAAFCPLLVQGGVSYLKNLDDNYFSEEDSILSIVVAAVDRKNCDFLSSREKKHLAALDYLLNDEPSKALAILCKLLESCPGDALALSLVIDLAYNLSDRSSAFHAATSVASYWNERGQRGASGQTAIQGHLLGTSLISLGLAMGGRVREAEYLADLAISRDKGGSAGLAAWALSHIYEYDGRSSEGASTFTGHGVEFFEPCGFLFFDARMSAIGAKFIMDRSSVNADRVALRLYDDSFGRIFEYSGYDGSCEIPVIRRVPGLRRQILVESATSSALSIFTHLLGKNNKPHKDNLGSEDMSSSDIYISESLLGSDGIKNIESVLTWLPPTSVVLSEATFLLFRLTMSGALASTDTRWSKLRNAWAKISGTEDSDRFLISKVAKAICSSQGKIYFDIADNTNSICGISCRLEAAADILGSLIFSPPSGFDTQKRWIKVVELLRDARSGWRSLGNDLSRIPSKIEFYNISYLPLGIFVEQAICYAAIMSSDKDALNYARSICSESITLRPNSPHSWHIYGMILQSLGDDENARDAFHASTSLGAGEGGRVGNN